MAFVELIINNKPVIVNPRSTILQACETAGIGLSRFCYHENLSVAGNCRRCLVEVQKSPKPVVACAIPVRKGRVIFTDTPLVRKARESVLEFLLVNHPLDCPICDQGGECDLQDETLVYGSDRGRYFEFKRSVENKECGPIVKTIITRCIHCTRCVRFSTEVAGNEIMGRFGRGEESEIGTYVNSFIATELSGNLVDLCPVGALTSKPYAYKVRNWELDQVDTVDFFDAIASNIVVYKAPSEEIVRILPRNDSRYAENWISDRTRYAFDGLKYMSNQNNFATSYKSFWTVEGYDFVRGSQVNLERVYAAKAFTSVKPYGSINQDFISPKLNLDIPFFYSFNRMFSVFAEDTRSSVMQIGTNLRFEASLLNTILRREQSRRGLQYVTVGAFSPLRYAHSHKGNSMNTLYSILENRITFVKQQYNSTKPLSILSGVDSLRNNYSTFIQKLIFLVGKLFFIKTASQDRLGFVHSSVGSLAFSHLGITSKMTQTDYTFKVASPIYGQNIALNSTFNYGMPSKTLYETDGHLLSLQGQRRKHVKVINPIVVNNLPKFNFESELCAIWKSEKKKVTEFKTFHMTNFWYGLQFFRDETPIATYLETSLLTFTFNPFAIHEDSLREAPLFTFAQPVHDFYLQQQIASTSTTIADCSLYQNQDSNFTKEI